MLSVPYNFTNNIKTTFAGFTIDEGNSIGFGDLTLLGKYRFLNNEKHKLHASFLAGIKMPTGETNETNEFGFKLGADDQPGTGSWDPLLGLALSKRFDRFSVDTSTLYRLSTKGSQDTIVGDVVNFNLGTSYHVNKINPRLFERIFPRKILGRDLDWNLVLELNGIWTEKVEFRGLKDNSHGGLTVFLSPGLRMSIDKKWISNLSIGFPVIEDLNGDQPATNLQMFFSLNRLF